MADDCMQVEEEEEEEKQQAYAVPPPKLNATWAKAMQRITNVTIGWLRQVTNQRSMFDLDMWASFVSPHACARTQDVEFDHHTTIALCECPRQPYRSCPDLVQGTMTGCALPKRPALNPATRQPMEYDLNYVFPVTMRICRYSNGLPVDLNAAIGGGPSTLQTETALRIARNAGREYLTFARLKSGKTHETQPLEDRGIAYRGADFGLLNERYLRAFAPIRPHHLRNGCVVLPDAVMQEAQLPFTTTPQDPNADIRSWILMPYDHIMAWSISSEDYEGRIREYGVRAIDPLRVKNKNTGEVRPLYWLIDNCSFERLCQHVTKRCLEPMQPRTLGQCGVDLYPADAQDYNWTELSVNKEVVPGVTSPEQVDDIMRAKRRLHVKYSLRYVVFPTGTAELANLAPRCPPDWYDRGQFHNPDAGIPIQEIAINADKTMKLQE